MRVVSTSLTISVLPEEIATNTKIALTIRKRKTGDMVQACWWRVLLPCVSVVICGEGSPDLSASQMLSISPDRVVIEKCNSITSHCTPSVLIRL